MFKYYFKRFFIFLLFYVGLGLLINLVFTVKEFANLDIFHNWKFQDIKVFYDKAFIKKYSMNACVYKEGSTLDYVYIIKKGEFKIVKTILTSTIDLNEMFMGDFEKILLGMNHK